MEQASTEGRKGTGVEIKLIKKRTVHKAILQVIRHSPLSPLYVFNTSSREFGKNLDKLKDEGDVPNRHKEATKHPEHLVRRLRHFL